MFKKYKQRKIDKQKIKEVVLGQHLELANKKPEIDPEEYLTVPKHVDGFVKSNTLLEVEYSIRKLDFTILEVLSDKFLTVDEKRAKVVDLEKQKHQEINRKIEILKYEIQLFKKNH